MKNGLKGKLAVDASALIDLLYCNESGQKLKTALMDDMVEAWATELAITELRYIVCRKLGWQESNARVNALLESGYFSVEDTLTLINGAAQLKCRRAISLPDCFTIALAKQINGKALFAKNEQDLDAEMRTSPFDVEVLFLADQ